MSLSLTSTTNDLSDLRQDLFAFYSVLPLWSKEANLLRESHDYRSLQTHSPETLSTLIKKKLLSTKERPKNQTDTFLGFIRLVILFPTPPSSYSYPPI